MKVTGFDTIVSAPTQKLDFRLKQIQGRNHFREGNRRIIYGIVMHDKGNIPQF